MTSTWRRIIGLWLLGVLAAAQLTKMAALSPILRREYGLSLIEMGALISLLEVGGATTGLVAGLVMPRFGATVFLRSGLLLLGAAGMAEAFAPGPTLLYVARAAEGFGYLGVVVAAPTLIAGTASARQQAAALTLWSTFVPVGVAVGGLVTGAMMTAFGVSTILGSWAMATLPALLLVASVPGDSARRVPSRAVPHAAAWLSTFSFGCYTAVVSATVGLLPSFLVEQVGILADEAGVVAGLAGFGAVFGSAAFLALRGASHGGHIAWWAALATLPAAAALACLVFTAGETALASGPLAFATIAFAAVTRPLVYTRLSSFAGATGGDDARLAPASGLLTQFGATGALAGPPLGAAIVHAWGWARLGEAVGAGLLLILVMQRAAERVHTCSRRST